MTPVRRPSATTAPPEGATGAAFVTALDVLRALADPTRMAIVATLADGTERACGTFPVDVAPSTLTHHFRVLREAGVIQQRSDGARRWTSLRRHELEARFPGLLDAAVAAYQTTEVR